MILEISVKLATDDRAEALDKRDEIIEKLNEIGIVLDLTSDGLHVVLRDDELPAYWER